MKRRKPNKLDTKLDNLTKNTVHWRDSFPNKQMTTKNMSLMQQTINSLH